MVERTTSEFEEFEGLVEDVELVENTLDSEKQQYHIKIKPTDIQVKGSTGLMHEWIGLSPKATDKSVPEGSVADKYLADVEIVVPAVKEAKTVKEAFELMKGKTFVFKAKKHGRSYDGHDAKRYWTPIKVVE